jgi:signal transduction histidine kinase
MLNKVSVFWTRFPLINLTGYLALAAVAIVELSGQPTDTRGAIIGFLLVFGLLLVAKPFLKVFSWQTHFYLALQTAVITTLLLLKPDSLMIPMLFCVSSVIACLALPLRTALIWVITFALITIVYWGTGHKWEEDGWMIGLPYAVGFIFCGASAYSLARSSAAQRRSETLLDELRTTHQQLQEYTTRVEELAVSQERNRLAREMHDALGHRLTVAAVQLEGAKRLIPTNPTRAAQMVNTVHEEVVEALAELRRTVATLRTPLDADLSLAAALTRLMTGFEEATGVKVNWLLPEEIPPLTEAYRLALYRMAQEALTNVQRHARAQQVWLELALENGLITLLVKDDGEGFNLAAARTGFGLRGLQERAAHLNGQFHIESNPGEGSQLCFHLSLPEASVTPATTIKSYSWKLICPLGLRSNPPLEQVAPPTILPTSG